MDIQSSILPTSKPSFWISTCSMTSNWLRRYSKPLDILKNSISMVCKSYDFFFFKKKKTSKQLISSKSYRDSCGTFWNDFSSCPQFENPPGQDCIKRQTKSYSDDRSLWRTRSSGRQSTLADSEIYIQHGRLRIKGCGRNGICKTGASTHGPRLVCFDLCCYWDKSYVLLLGRSGTRTGICTRNVSCSFVRSENSVL